MPATGSFPLRYRALRAILRALPRGRYRALATIAPKSGHCVVPLAADLGGALFDCDLGDQIEREVCFTGMYEPPVSRIYCHHLRSGGTVIDVGANWGYFSLIAAVVAGTHSRVIALEPDPRQHARLCQNLELNAFHHVQALASAAAAGEGQIRLAGYAHGHENRGTSTIGASGSDVAFQVPTVALDRIVGTSTVDLVKIDVEGAEDLVLAGMRDGLSARRYRTILLELHPEVLHRRGIDPQRCIQWLLDYGYRGWTIDGSSRGYARALDDSSSAETFLLPLDRWQGSPWPHLLWLC